jgi:L-ascorbate metabolism protein UlaG (beta-lactamase superfamily)
MGRFSHLATTPARGALDILKWKLIDPLRGRGRRPSAGYVTPSRPYDHALVHGDRAELTWIGHASFLLGLGTKRLLIDPVLRTRLGPVSRCAPVGIPPEELPPIDAILITHNHRDHLDIKSLAMFDDKKKYIIPLGNARSIEQAGGRDIVELDWWESTTLGQVEITLVPARHWSMRSPADRNGALWGGYVIRGPEGVAYHSGDTAFFDGFAEIADRLGPIDWAMLPIGAYEPRWFMKPQHMCPEEAVLAARLLRAKHMVAMHWGTFVLTDEPLGEPPERARAAFASEALPDQELWVLDVGETRAL